MESEYDLVDQLTSSLGVLKTSNRALRLRLAYPEGSADDTLLPQRISGGETICGGIEYRILCVAADASLPLKSFIGVAAELRLVTDQGDLHSICGVITEARSGQSDGGLATYQLVLRDALALMDLTSNARVFLGKSEIDIIKILLGELRERFPAIGLAFEYELAYDFTENPPPPRAFTMQFNEPDGAFLRRLLKRRGIAWFFRPGRSSTSTMPDDGLEHPPAHTLVLFTEPIRLHENAAGTVRYHRFGATEERDTITAWSAVRSLRAGSASGYSWDYADPLSTMFMTTSARNTANQGTRGNALAAGLDDYRIETPHVGDDRDDQDKLTEARAARHAYESKYFHGESNVRDLRVGEWNSVEGHAEIDRHPAGERSFVITSLQVTARNNLPKAIDARIDRIFAINHWNDDDGAAAGAAAGMDDAARYHNSFTCVRRGIRIVPSYDPRVDVPFLGLQSATVVGPAGETVHCDKQGRVKVRFHGMREADHAHADGKGTLGTDADSAWVRVATSWAGNGPGSQYQFGANLLPRVGTEVLIGFVDGDPDKPIIIDQTYNGRATTAALSERGELPGNRYQSGLASREIGGGRGNQLRFDDTKGQISAQLASDHGVSELNLGWCTEPRSKGFGAPRGEGAELRSDEYIAVRAAKGMLLSAWKRVAGSDGATGSQLARAEYLCLMRDCSELFGALGKYAAKHLALAQDGKAQDDLKSAFERWENGSNTAPNKPDGGAPVIGVTAPDGIYTATSKAIVIYAGLNIDTVAQQHLQMTAGQRFNLNAGKGISLFSHHDGLSAIAHQGRLLLQSQHDDTEINAANNFRITATDGKITVMAKQIELVAKDGSFIQIGDGITMGSNEALKFHAPDFTFDEPTSLHTEFPTFDSGGTDLKFAIKYYPHIDGGLDASNLAHQISTSAGENHSGKSDAGGKSTLLKSDAMHLASIDLRDSATDN
jgi:type VI secretion system secreted protein VgrG